MQGEYIKGRLDNGKPITGKVILVYTDALASGTRDYTPVTYLKVQDEDSITYDVRPRDVDEVIDRDYKLKNDIKELQVMLERVVDSLSPALRGTVMFSDHQSEVYDDAVLTVLTWRTLKEHKIALDSKQSGK